MNISIKIGKKEWQTVFQQGEKGVKESRLLSFELCYLPTISLLLVFFLGNILKTYLNE